MCLLASEILAVTGQSPSQHYKALTDEFGAPAYARVDAPATREQKAVLAQLSPEQVTATELVYEPITAKLTRAPGNDAPIGGLKVTTESAGSPPVRPAPKTYTRSMPSPSGEDHPRSSKRKLAKWSPTLWARSSAIGCGTFHPR